MSHNIFKTLFFVTLSLLTANCENPSDTEKKILPDNHEKVTITQGVWGNVWFWEGNFMPSTDNSSHGTITPVERDIYVFEATRFDSAIRIDVNEGGIFYDSILTKQITKLRSDNTGFYQIELPPGKYSFFVKEDSLYFGNEGDSDGHLMSARVAVDSVTKRQININYRAAY